MRPQGGQFKEDDGTWKGNDDGKVVNSQPQRVMDDRNGMGPGGGYIGRSDGHRGGGGGGARDGKQRGI